MGMSMRERPECRTSKSEPARHAVAPAKAAKALAAPHLPFTIFYLSNARSGGGMADTYV